MAHLYDPHHVLNFNEGSSQEYSVAQTFEEAYASLLSSPEVPYLDHLCDEGYECPIKAYDVLDRVEDMTCPWKDFADFSLNLSEAEKHDVDNVVVNKRELYRHCGNLDGLGPKAISFFEAIGNSYMASASLANIVVKLTNSVIDGSHEETACVLINAHIEAMDTPLWHVDAGMENKYFVVAPLSELGTLFCKLDVVDKTQVFENNAITNSIEHFPAGKCSSQGNSADVYEMDRYAAAILKYKSTVHAIPPTSPYIYGDAYNGRVVVNVDPMSAAKAVQMQALIEQMNSNASKYDL